ncbi:acetyl-CoA carboxylase 1-like protein [Tanacetum coccineum]
MYGPLGVGTLLQHSLGQTAFSQKGSMIGEGRSIDLPSAVAKIYAGDFIRAVKGLCGALWCPQRRFSLLASSALMKLWVWVNKSSKDLDGLAIKSLNNRPDLKPLMNAPDTITHAIVRFQVSGDFQSVWHVVIPYTISEGRCHEVSFASNRVVVSGSTLTFSTKVFPKVLLGCASSESKFHGSIYGFLLTRSLGFGSEVAFKGSPGLAMRESCKYIEDKLGVKVNKLRKETLVNCAKTSMSSKKKLRCFSSKFREKYLTTSKDIEEGPITVAPQETIKKLEQAARRLAKSVNYVGAANVEYLYSMETGDYYFLELNPRLQEHVAFIIHFSVEHTVMKWIAKINLPAAQVAVGMGIPLWQIPEIRRFYGMDNSGGYDAWRATLVNTTPFDFEKAESIRPKGHCVAVRVTSVDPDDGFKPIGGKVQELSHALAFGESRTLAIANMVLGLKEIQIRDEIRTNVDYTIDLLHAPDYRDNKIHTGWLDSRIAMRVRAKRPPWYLLVVGGALYKAAAGSAAMVSDYVGYLEKGQIPPKHIYFEYRG